MRAGAQRLKLFNPDKGAAHCPNIAKLPGLLRRA
jgi:hypothetical protein